MWRCRRGFHHLWYRSTHTESTSVSRAISRSHDDDPVARILDSLKRCGSARDLAAAREVHASVARSKHLALVFVANSVMSVFLKCGSMGEARLVFEAMENRNVVSWNTMILGYASSKEEERALELFQEMVSQGFLPSSRTYVGVLVALSGQVERVTSGKVEILNKVMDLHSQALRRRDVFNGFLANRLIDTYAKCGSLLDARMVFDRMIHHDVVSFTSIVLACVDNGEAKFGLEVFERMTLQRDARSYAAALKACSVLSAVQSGRKIHDEIYKRGLWRDGFLCNSLLDLYTKCGSMDEALQVFESMSSGSRNLVSWSSLIAGYGRTGDTERVVELFHRMREDGMLPDDITFLSLLRACGHGGFVEKAKEFFAAMVSQYGIPPSLEHYHCMVDILGQANLLDDAVAMAETMPFDATPVTWNTVLAACWKWKNIEMAKLAFESSLRLDATQGLAYVLMANVYRSVGMWEEQSKIIGMKNSKDRSRLSCGG